eukprot:3365553-Pleurochrysis_carterae.AAC.2
MGGVSFCGAEGGEKSIKGVKEDRARGEGAAKAYAPRRSWWKSKGVWKREGMQRGERDSLRLAR